MAKFEMVSRFAEEPEDVTIPVRATKCAAGYDLAAAENYLLNPFDVNMNNLASYRKTINDRFTLKELADITKSNGIRPTLVSTGVKVQLDDDEYLEISARSSLPLKHWIVVANGVGIIDADYYNNPDNEGEIFVQLINLSPFYIQINRGDVIAQGIIKKYGKVVDDSADAERLGGFGSTTK